MKDILKALDKKVQSNLNKNVNDISKSLGKAPEEVLDVAKKCSLVHEDLSANSLITELRVFINEQLGESYINEETEKDNPYSTLAKEEAAIQDTYDLILREISKFEKKIKL